MPSVLIETGFLTNPAEEKYLTSEKGQDALAHSFFNAFKNYKASVESGETGVATEKKSPPPEEDHDTATKEDVNVKDSPVLKDTGIPELKTGDSKPAEPRYTGKPKTVLVDAGTLNAVYTFAVQVLSSTVKLKAGDPKFHGQKDLVEEKDNALYKYTTPRCATIEEAITVQGKMQDAGFKGAFVVAYKQNKRISLKQAREEMKGAQ